MAKKWRLILDDKNNGFYNMAVDEAILLNYSYYKIPTLRIYGWDNPFISLGYNQIPEKVINLKEDIPFVRRITGGCAILHDREITYSITCTESDLSLADNIKGVKNFYRVLCSFIIDFYSSLGLKAHFARDFIPSGFGRYGNFCFSSCEEFDIMISGKKIGGNAQRRKHDLVFQHGSIPQKIDFEFIEKTIIDSKDAKSKATSLDNLLRHTTYFASLRSLLADSFKRAFAPQYIENGLSVKEKSTVKDLLENKYSKREWNFNRQLANHEKTLVA